MEYPIEYFIEFPKENHLAYTAVMPYSRLPM